MKNLKIKLTVALTFLFAVALVSQNEIEFRTDGIVAPRLNSANVINPSKGQMIFDTIIGEVMYYDGSAWQQFSSGGGQGASAPDTIIESSLGQEFVAVNLLQGERNIRFGTNGLTRAIIDDQGRMAVGGSTTGLGVFSIHPKTGVDLFRVYKSQSNNSNFIIKENGFIGIHEDNPDTTFHINGTIKIEDGTQGAGKILRLRAPQPA